MLGSFVSVYNYLSYRMQAAPFFLPHEILALFYLMYIAGSAGSMAAGTLSDKFSAHRVLPAMITLLLAGLLFMLTSSLVLILLGLGIFTAGFFGSYTLSSKIVALYSRTDKPASISLYFLFYYAGSSLLGTGSGVVMHKYGWAVFIFALCALSMINLLISAYIRRKIENPSGIVQLVPIVNNES
jgi:YNFM family putative membrane transporter